MWVFYLISLPLTMGMVALTLMYFAGPHVPRYVGFTVAYTWFCSLSIIILVPADIWTTIIGHDKGGISFFWGWSYWSTFLLTWWTAGVGWTGGGRRQIEGLAASTKNREHREKTETTENRGIFVGREV